MTNNNIVLVREYDEENDKEQVGRLERNCEMIKASNAGSVSIFTNMMGKGDPLGRVRLYPLHVMLVAEMRESKVLVGVVRGCIKNVVTKQRGQTLKLGCILGLRVSPKYRRMGIGFQLVRSVEEWIAKTGAEYTFLATEKNNAASTNLFTIKCNYSHLSSLMIFSQTVGCSPITRRLSQDVKIEKLAAKQAISLYDQKLGDKDMYPTDMEAILNEKMSLGTWVCYFKDKEKSVSAFASKDDDGHEMPSSWVMFSIWNSCDTSKREIQIETECSVNYLHAALSNARERMFRCLKLSRILESSKTFGFLFLYGIHGEGESAGELLKVSWASVLRLAQTLKGCNAIITELGASDPLVKYFVRRESSGVSCVNDIWYVKRVRSSSGEEDEPEVMKEGLGNVFVDPRDF